VSANIENSDTYLYRSLEFHYNNYRDASKLIWHWDMY